MHLQIPKRLVLLTADIVSPPLHELEPIITYHLQIPKRLVLSTADIVSLPLHELKPIITYLLNLESCMANC